MNFEEIQKLYDEKEDELRNEIREHAETRIRELVARLARFKIRRIIVGMGTWTIDGDDFTAVGEDGDDEDVEVRPIGDLVDWVAEYEYRFRRFELGWDPKDITGDEITALLELYRMEIWMEDNIGGADVSFE